MINKPLALHEKSSFLTRLRTVASGVWAFPAVLTLLLIVLTLLKISGSSIGIYNQYFTGSPKSPALIAGQPRAIRSDEWVVNTQMTIAQKNTGFARINHNIGKGEDMSVILDVPYKEWSEIFRPQNWSFFVMPFDNAFAFKWWVMGYLLMLSCYFFVLSLCPGKKVIAASLSVALFFSAFVQWWYQYITLGPLYYSLFMGILVIKFLKEKRQLQKLLLLAALSYVLVCFALVIYPPFQIPCAIAIGSFLVGNALQQRGLRPSKDWWHRIFLLGASALAAVLIVGLFLATRLSVIQTINQTAYPGQRIVQSGGYNLPHFLAGNLGIQFENDNKAAAYVIPNNSISNQSEASGFILLVPFLFLPSLWIIYHDYRKKIPSDWALITTNLALLTMLGWLFIPHLTLLGKILILDKVPLNRLIIGIGLINLIIIVLVMRRLFNQKKQLIPPLTLAAYIVAIFILQLAIGLHAQHVFPGFIKIHKVVALALPIPIVVLLLFKQRFNFAMLGLAAFAVVTSASVNPLYRGTAVLSANPLVASIKNIASTNNGRWITDVGTLENVNIMSGVPSLSGVYDYPQLNLWKPLDPTGSQQYLYNRYAHVNFVLDRNTAVSAPSKLILPVADHLGVLTEPCGPFLKQADVRFIVTEVPIVDSCASLQQSIKFPAHNFLIYRIN